MLNKRQFNVSYARSYIHINSTRSISISSIVSTCFTFIETQAFINCHPCLQTSDVQWARVWIAHRFPSNSPMLCDTVDSPLPTVFLSLPLSLSLFLCLVLNIFPVNTIF